MELQHVNVKLHIADAGGLDLTPLIPVFHNWIQGQVFGDLLLDIADYRHVPAGPGVVLIGQDGDYALDQTDNRLGMRYNRKSSLSGTNQDRLVQAVRAALVACRRLESEPSLNGKFRFGGHEIEVFINDRLLAPNSDATREATQADLDALFRKLFRGGNFSLTHGADPRRLFAVTAKSGQPFNAGDLLANLNT